MAILKVSRLGHPVLRKPSEAVPKEAITTPAMQAFLKDMVETMREYDGVGLAAPQVHVGKQIAVIEVHDNPRYRNAPAVPLTYLVNPKITAYGKEQIEDWEGCLSIEGFRGKVPRAAWVDVEAYNEQGKPVQLRAEGFFARVVQHECDHLAGKVYLDRMSNLQTLTHMQEFTRYWND